MVPSPSRPPLWLLGLLGLVYFGAAKAGLALAVVNPSATAVWPPAGIALATVLVYGPRAWPAIAIGAFFANLTTAGTPITSAGIAFGNTLEALLGAWLVNRYAGGRRALTTVPGIFLFLALGAGVSTLVSATVGVTTLTLGGLAAPHQYRAIWTTWWLGDAVGDLVVTPLLLAWLNGPAPGRPRHLVEATAAIALFAVTAVAYFGGIGTPNAPIGWFWIPVTIWVSYRFGRRSAATMIFGIAITTVVGTMMGYGPFVLPSRNASFLLLQAFLGVTSLSSMTLTAVVLTQERALAEVRSARDGLEDRVRERTEALSRLYESLKAEIAERLRLQKELVEAGETERLRLGRDLHDDLGQLLTGIGFLSGALEKRLASEGRAEVDGVGEIRKLVQEAIAKTRILSMGLTPVLLGTAGLRPSVLELVGMTERVFDVACSVDYPPDLFVERPVASTNLYRIVQEAISNAVRHGGSRRIEIAFSLEGEYLKLVVRDDGDGFRPAAPDRKGLGLDIMRYRAEMLGGTLEVRPSREGTTVVCIVPGVARRDHSRVLDEP